MARAGWFSGMFSAVKLYHCVSISGPSAIEKPRSAKISASSSMTWLTGWTVPEIDPFGRELALQLGCFERRLAGCERVADGFSKRVNLRRFRGALFGAHLAERLELGRDLALLAKQPHA